MLQLDGMNKDEMSAVMTKFNMKSPITGNDLSEPIEFNLMFGTQIGPSGLIKGFVFSFNIFVVKTVILTHCFLYMNEYY